MSEEVVAAGIVMPPCRHCQVIGCEPATEKSKLTVWPRCANLLGGGFCSTNGSCTVSTPTALVALPQRLVATALYDPASLPRALLTVKVGVLAPEMFPPSCSREPFLRHSHPSAVLPMAPAVKVAVWPAFPDWSAGSAVGSGL